MLKFVFAAIIFGLIAIAIIVMVVINFTYKSVKKLREEVEDNYYRNQKMKEQKEKYSFNNDYFKSSKGGRRQSRTQAQYEQREQASRDKNPFGDDYFKSVRQEQPRAQQAEKENTARRTATSSGVTIIDGRDQEEKRKIFDHSDGEYVEFEEV
jgi:ABC-type anion transport system duplicated permease subunit